MPAATDHYRLLKKIKDERFEEEALHLYNLVLHVGVRDFQVLIISDDHRVLLLEDYVLPEIGSAQELQKSLDVIFEAHEVLKAGFWKSISVAFKTQKFVQVPSSLFAEESINDYLLLNAPVDISKESILKVDHPGNETVTVFAVGNHLLDWFTKQYPSKKLNFTHQSASLIEGILRVNKKQKNSPLYVYVDRFKLHILACHNGGLLYYNQFPIHQFQDYVRYIMLVMNSLKMDPQTSEVKLWGFIGKNSPHYHEFYKFIKNVSFGDRPDHIKFGYLFDEVQEHNFFDLYCIDLTTGVE